MGAMGRRDFFRRLAAATAAAVAAAAVDIDPSQVDVERILWTPGEKTIFLPPAQGWKPQGIIPAQEMPKATELSEWHRWHDGRIEVVEMPDGKRHAVHHTAYTARGRADFDVHGNLLRIGHQLVISSEDHARMEVAGYVNHGHLDHKEYVKRLPTIMTRRMATGVYDAPIRRRPSYGDFDWRG